MAFSNSKLATVKVPAHVSNYTKGRIDIIRKITVHHMGGINSAYGCGQIFARAGRGGSAHYGIGNLDGAIGQYVDEKDTAWTDSNWPSNCCSVTIEVSNSATSSEYPVSEAAFNSLVKLCADIAKRNNLGKLVVGKNLTYHQMYAATACPGPTLIRRMKELAERANDINYPSNEHKLDGMDVKRRKDNLIFYTVGDHADTNKYGTECRIKNYKCVAIESGKGKMKLDGGWVLSGHGEAEQWIKKKIKVGSKVVRDGNKVVVK